MNTAVKNYIVALPNKGISSSQPEELLADNLSPYSRNMQHRDGYLDTRAGLTKFSQTALTGRIMEQFRFVQVNGDVYNLFFTTTDIYAYDFSNSRFNILTPVYTTGTIEVQVGTPTILRGTGTAWLANVKIGDYVKIGAGSIHTGSTWYRVTVVTSDVLLTVASAMPTTAALSAYVIRKTYTGGNEDFWSVTKFSDDSLGDIVIATNGVETPIYTTGAAAAVAITGLPSTMKAKYVESVYSRVIFGYTVEGGQNQPERWRLSAAGNCLSYNALEFGDLVDDLEGITGLKKFGDYIIATKDKRFYQGRFVGGADIIDFEDVIAPVGCKSNRSIVIDKQWFHYYGYDKKFHRWNTVTDQAISEEQFEETSAFDPNLEAFINGANFYHKNQIRWMCPLSASDYNNVLFVWDYKNESMQIWTCGAPQALLSIGFYTVQSDIYFDDAIWGDYYFDEREEYFDDITFVSSAPIFIYGGYDGYVRICDSGTTDDGTAFTRIFRAKRLNFKQPSISKRLWKQQFWFQQDANGSVSLSIYVDDNNSATGIDTMSLLDATRDIVKLNVTCDLRGQDFQVELSSTSYFSLLGFISYYFPKRRSF